MKKVLFALLAFSILSPSAVFAAAAKPGHAHHKVGSRYKSASKGKKHKRSKGKKAGYANSKHKAYAKRQKSVK